MYALLVINKKDSLENIINHLQSGVVMLQETKLYKKGTYKNSNYDIFEAVRGKNEGGGLLTMVHKNFSPVLIPSEENSKMRENILVVESNIGKSRVRYINAYGVQETSSSSDKMEFYSILDQEIENALNNNCMVCVQLDANGKVGSEIINGDPHGISHNGQLLLDLIERKSLILVNGTEKCSGIITRTRNKNGKIEKSVIDYFLVCQSFYNLIISMVIDEERKLVLTKFSKFNGCTQIVKSDHNILYLKVKCSWSTSLKTERVEIFNLRNKECQKQFFEDTNSTSILSNSLENRQVVGGGKIWLKNLNTIIHRNFKKIRITAKHKEDKIQKLITNRRNEN